MFINAPRARGALIVLTLLLVPAGVAQAATHRSAKRRTAAASRTEPSVLLVGTYNGKAGQFTTIQAAVDAAKPGDWILLGPGDYKQTSSRAPAGALGDDIAGAHTLITKKNLHIRGMNRNTVMIDGTKPGSPECSAAAADQIFGAKESNGRYVGNNGIVVYKANGVHLQNFSTCNFLGQEHGGDSVWFDGGAASGKQAIGTWWGEFLSSTSTYWEGTAMPSDEYGIYASNTYGKGVFDHTFTNNMSDSGYYIGACPDCNSIINHARSESNDLGYSGTNSGGHLIIENSVFNNNQEGVATQSQNNDDAPSPQEGICPNGATNPKPPPGAQRTNVCWVMIHNKVTNNNNGATPISAAAPGLVGTGLTIAGGRHDLVVENTFSGNSAWGVALLPYPATESPPEVAKCQGGVGTGSGETYVCYFDDWANEVEHNTFSNNGGFGNPTNGDIGEVSNPNADGNCWHNNVEAGGGEPTSYPPAIQTTHGTCGQPNSGEPITSVLAAEAICDSQLVTPCPEIPGANYPHSPVKMMPLPQEPTMANPCRNVPANAWCSGAASTTAARRTRWE